MKRRWRGSPLDLEFHRLGLVRRRAVVDALRIDPETLAWLVKVGDIVATPVEWKGTTLVGFDPDQFAGRMMRCQDGRPRLISSR